MEIVNHFSNSIKTNVSITAACFVFLSLGCATHASLITPSYIVESNKIKNVYIKIVLIADLHNDVYGKEQDVLIQKIKSIEPDLIFLAGDLVDDRQSMDGTRFLLKGLKGVAPTFYVTGNHEYMSRRYGIEAIRREIQAYGVTILSDSYTKVNIKGQEIVIAGVEDPLKKRYEDKTYDYKKIALKFSELNETESYTILLSHRPETIRSYPYFDLVVSGHAHGGQVVIPKLINGLYAPHQGLFPRYAGGRYQHGKQVHIVSRGLTVKLPRLPRIFNPPELVVIYLNSLTDDPRPVQ
jgi:predicted MPP superfamily phosphohydrolase